MKQWRVFSLGGIMTVLGGCGNVEETHSETKGLYLTKAHWANNKASVCFVPESTVSNKEKLGVKSLVENTWLQHIDFKFTGWKTCGSKGADIKILMGKGTKRGWSYIGAYSRSKSPSMALRDFENEGKNQNYYRYGIVHEFGHALGIRHEHTRIDRPADWNVSKKCGGKTSKGKTIGNYDRQSIMNYCQPARPVLSAGDIATIKAMYGNKNSSR